MLVTGCSILDIRNRVTVHALSQRLQYSIAPMLRFSISIEDDRLYQGNVKVRLNILFYNENWLISKIPPIPPFPKGGTSTPPLLKGAGGIFMLARNPTLTGPWIDFTTG